ncbi:MAG: hypothetical protein L0154_24685 [Chloroflexi bacterium]|nr:hypothetical protein [Chloroflexota bacterium]
MTRNRLILLTVCLLGISVLFSPSAEADTPTQESGLAGKTIYLALANGEISLLDREDTGASRLAALLVRDGADFDIVNWQLPIPDDADLVILMAPTTAYDGSQTATLWTYVNGGGSIMVANDAGGGLDARSALVDLLWNRFGIQIQGVYLLSEGSETPEVVGPLTAVQDHPVLNNVDLATVTMDGACAMTTDVLVPSSVEVMALVHTTGELYGESDTRAYQRDGVFEYNIGPDIAIGEHTVLAVSENSRTGSRVLVVCDGSIARNDTGLTTSPPGTSRFVYPGNVQLLVNSVYWLLNANPPVLQFDAPAPTATPTVTPSPTPEPSPTEEESADSES